jgi:predicted nucleic acid-binding protein
MSAFADASFLFALYRQQPGNDRAMEWMAAASDPPKLSPLLVFEFEQAVRFEVFRRGSDRTKVFSEIEALNLLSQFEIHLARRIFAVSDFDAARVVQEASRISEKHTIRRGVRAFDILHVATALVLGTRQLLTFDIGQRTLAEAEGLTVPF